MKEANFSKWLLTIALIFLAGALLLHGQSGSRLGDVERDVFKQVAFARVAYEEISKEIGSLANKTSTAQGNESVAEAKAEFEQNLASIVDSLRLQAQLVGVGQNADEVRAATGVTAKSTVERAEDLATKLIAQSGTLVRPGESTTDPQYTASVTNAMQKAFDDSKQRQATALAGMIKESVSPEAARQIADELPATWKREVGKTVALDDDEAKKALKKAEWEERKVAVETRKEAEAAAGLKAKAGQAAMAQAMQAQADMAAQAMLAQSGMGIVAPSNNAVEANPYNPQISQSFFAQPAGSGFKLDAIDEVLIAYRDTHLPTKADTPVEIWNKMRWMLKMGFDSRALDCLDGYRSACLAESGEEELDDFTKLMVDSAEKFIKDMRELDVSGGVLVSSIIKQEIADADEASGRESYHVGDIITSIGTNTCCTVDDLMANYAEGQLIQVYYLEETGELTNMTQEASGQDLEETYQFREISK